MDFVARWKFGNRDGVILSVDAGRMWQIYIMYVRMLVKDVRLQSYIQYTLTFQLYLAVTELRINNCMARI